MGEADAGEVEQQPRDPQQPERDVEAVRARERELAREEGAAIGAIAKRDQRGKFGEFDREEDRAEHECDAEPARKARGQQAAGLDGDQLQIVDLRDRQAAGSGVAQRGVCSKERGE